MMIAPHCPATDRKAERQGVLAIVQVLANQAIAETRRYLVRSPLCPNWSKPASDDFTNARASNMVWSSADLAGGRPLRLADAIPAVAAVQRCQSDKIELPTAVTVGPIGAPSTQAPGRARGGAGGSQT